MARRGKVKYKDVVKKPGQSKNQKSQKNHRPRKTYSLFKNGNKSNAPKRRYYNNNTSVEENQAKKQKLEQVVDKHESSSEGEIDDFSNLLSTFKASSKTKKSVAIDSSSESDNDDIEGEANLETEDEDLTDQENGSSSIYEDQNSSGEEQNSSDEEENSSDEEENSSDEEENSSDEEQNSSEENKDRNAEEEIDEPTDEDDEVIATSEIEGEKDDDMDDPDEIEVDLHKTEEEESADDPFGKHVFYELKESLVESLQHNPVLMDSYSENWPELGKLIIQIPTCEKQDETGISGFSIAEKKTFAPGGTIPRRLPKAAKPSDLFIKSQIISNLPKVNKNACGSDNFTPLQSEVFSIMNSYQDLYYPHRTFNNGEELRYVYCVHAVNHILKTRLKVIHHNARLSKKDEVPEEFRDQGLVRPKVLFIVPFKDAAYKIVRMLIDLILPEDKGNVMNKNRFIQDYTGNELVLPKKNPKPEDYEQTFQGNSSDDFKIGITVTKKSLKLYANFYSSDVIIASPLGLRTIIGAEGEAERDYDFLASIELLIMDQTEIFLMQNWDHVLHTLSHLHLQPKDSHGTDFSRVRVWSLNGWAKYYRQTLIFSSAALPEINSIFNKKCLNYAGKVKVVNPIECGSIGQVVVQVPHVYHRFDCQSAADAIDARFDFFVNKILPQHRESLMKQTLIFVPSYFDFVRLRNYFKKEDISFVQICEYSKEAKVARARDMFFHGDGHFLLYTERFHFFNRKRIKGIRHLLFYQPPMFSHFYYEMCNLMQENNQNRKLGRNSNMSVTVIYSKYDVHQLSAIVSTEKALKMVQSDRKVHMMVTGGD